MANDSEHPDQHDLITQLLDIEHDTSDDTPAHTLRAEARRAAYRMVEEGILERWAFQEWLDKTHARVYAEGWGACVDDSHRRMDGRALYLGWQERLSRGLTWMRNCTRF